MRRYLTSLSILASFCCGQGFTIRTVAGDGVQGFAGDNGLALNAEIFAIAGLAVDGSGNVYIADTGNCRIRKVAVNGNITTVAGTAVPGYSGDNGPAINASLSFPRGVTVDAGGNMYIADSGNNVVRKVDNNGIITTIAGNSTAGYAGDGGPAINAALQNVSGIAFDAAGNMYLADRDNARVRKIALDGTISTFAGTGVAGFSGDGGPAVNAQLYSPNALAFDLAGNLYVADSSNNAVRKISPAGIITTIVGMGPSSPAFSGDGGLAINALANDPQGVTVDNAGNVYFTDEDNERIRMISPAGIITTIAGDGTKNFTGDGGPSANSEVDLPEGITLGPGGALYFVDSGNKRVRVLTPTTPQLPAVSAGGVVSASAFGEFAAIAPGDWIEIYGTNLALGINSWAASNFTGNAAPTSLNGTSVTIGGASAFVEYADPGHINVQVPSSVATGSQPLIVTTGAGVSAPYSVTVNATEPGLLAPASFIVGGANYVVALFSDGATYVLPPGAIAGVPSKRAQPGDIITLFGVGFGPVTPAVSAGQIVQQVNALTSAMQVSFAGTAAVMSYAGLAPGAVGLYQFNLTVPNVPASDTTPLTFTLGSVPGTQKLVIAVQ
jgi:uncharacterized protein (TIGR03437 family)